MFVVRFHRFLKNHTSIPICHGQYGPCFCHGERRRQYTQYVIEGKNWVFLCDTCAEANNEYWKEMWKEYYASVL